MNNKAKTQKKSSTNKSKSNQNNVVGIKSLLNKQKPKAHPFASFIETKNSESKLNNQSYKPSTQNIPYRKKAV